MSLEFAELTYTLTSIIVARYNKTTDVYETPGVVENGQIVEVEPEADNDELRGYGVKVALLSVLVGAKLRFGNGGVDFSTLAIVSGMSTQTSSTTPNQIRTADITFGGAGLPYFGLLGQTESDDGGRAIVGLRCCKLDTFPKWTLDGMANKFNLSEVNGKAIPVSSKLMRIKNYETASGFTAPTTGADFKAFFTTPA